jgi:hypothetical protein
MGFSLGMQFREKISFFAKTQKRSFELKLVFVFQNLGMSEKLRCTKPNRVGTNCIRRKCHKFYNYFDKRSNAIRPYDFMKRSISFYSSLLSKKYINNCNYHKKLLTLCRLLVK